jgi:hypothetical protein
MTEIVEPKPDFRSFAESAIVAALQDPDPTNPSPSFSFRSWDWATYRM